MPNTPLHIFPIFFPKPAKLPPLRIMINFSSCLLLVHLVVMWELSGLIVSHREANGNWGSLFHFLPSYIIQNSRPANCHLLSRWYLVRLIWPWRRRRYIPPKHWLTFIRLHGVISS
jgi:hypothetical protein